MEYSRSTRPPSGRGLENSICSGGHRRGETPGSIPNPEVKPSTADGTALETEWESRSPPGTFGTIEAGRDAGLDSRPAEPATRPAGQKGCRAEELPGLPLGQVAGDARRVELVRRR